MTSAQIDRRAFLGGVSAMHQNEQASHYRDGGRARRHRSTERDYQTALRSSYRQHLQDRDGAVATSPSLRTMPAELFGMSLTDGRGVQCAVGDSERTFTIQSISKVFTLALVLQESGEDVVERNIGVNSTGSGWGSIEAIERQRGRAINPMVTPGAIAVAGRVKGDLEAAWTKVLATHSAFAGRQLAIDDDVYRVSLAGAVRNRAIATLLAAYEDFVGDPGAVLDLYERQCAIRVTAQDLSVMAATLANGGVNPLTRERVVDARHVAGILAIMATAGLYENSGQWLFRTGLPGKSGVGGGLIAVCPRRFGVAAFSPRLDEAGNSVRGQRAIAELSAAFGANIYDA